MGRGHERKGFRPFPRYRPQLVKTPRPTASLWYMLQVEGAVKFDITEGVLSMFACTNRTNGIDSPKPVNVGSLYKGIKVGWGWGGGGKQWGVVFWPTLSPWPVS